MISQVSEDDFCLPQAMEQQLLQRSFRGTIALKVSKRKPKPTQKILEMEAELLSKAKQERMEEVRNVTKLNSVENHHFSSGEEDQQDRGPGEGRPDQGEADLKQAHEDEVEDEPDRKDADEKRERCERHL